MTNGDKIRAMSDEDLARFLSTHPILPATCDFYKPSCAGCRKCWLEWLGQESEGDMG